MPTLLTKKQFKAKRPNGSYDAYLNYIIKNGSPAMKKLAKQAKSGKAPVAGAAGAAGGVNALAATTPLTNAQLNAQVEQLLAAQVSSSTQPIERARQMAAQEIARRTASIQGFTSAMMPALQQVAPQTTAAYQGAASAQGALAQGFSDSMQATAQQVAARDKADMAKLAGAPVAQQTQEGAQVAPAGAGDVMYGAGGYIPATSMGREGAAWAANAAQLPAIASAQGAQAVKAAQWEGAQTDADFANQLAELTARIPAMRTQILMDLQNLELQKQATAMGWASLNADTSLAKAGLRQDAAQFAAGQALDFAQIGASTAADAAAAAADAKDASLSAQSDREDAKIKFQTILRGRDIAEDAGIITTKKVRMSGFENPLSPNYQKYTTTPVVEKNFTKAMAKLKSYLAPEIKRLRNMGIKQTVINRMLRDYLKTLGIKPVASTVDISPGIPGLAP